MEMDWYMDLRSWNVNPRLALTSLLQAERDPNVWTNQDFSPKPEMAMWVGLPGHGQTLQWQKEMCDSCRWAWNMAETQADHSFAA